MRIRLFCILLILAMFGCTKNNDTQSKNASQNAESLTVSAAISLKDVFDEIGTVYQNKSVVKINFNYGASGALQRQIENGAPADVFAGAGERQMDELEKGGLIDSSSRRNFAGNSLVLVVPKDSKLNIEKFEDLAKTEITKVAVGNPKTVPAGQYAEESLTKMNLKTSIQTKLVLAENVRQVLDYVVRGEVDAGIVYQTDALTAKDRVNVVATAAENTHSPILYPLVIVKEDKKQAAREFTNFVLSAEGQNILRKYGFKGVSEK